MCLGCMVKNSVTTLVRNMILTRSSVWVGPMIHEETHGFLAHGEILDGLYPPHQILRFNFRRVSRNNRVDSPHLWSCFHTWPQQGHLINNRAMTLVEMDMYYI